MNETDLHYRVIRYMREYHEGTLVVPGLGEHQDSPEKRKDGWSKGYTGGQPDILIISRSGKHSGLAIELKTPKGHGKLSEKQSLYLSKLRTSGFKTLVSGDYDEVHRCIDEYLSDISYPCSHCTCVRMFKSVSSLANHEKWIHRVIQ